MPGGTYPYASTTDGSFYVNGDSADLYTAFIYQGRDGSYQSIAAGATTIDFTPAVDVTYSISGRFTNSDGEDALEAYLYDQSTSTYAFDNYQANTTTTVVNQTFGIGFTAGNFYDYLSGSLTGTLTAGHNYEWFVYAYTEAYPIADGGATAYGQAEMLLTPQSVPEPSSIMLAAMAAAGLVTIAARHRTQL